ncbi:hypothetical protein [Microbacterium sp. CPCC 204701]|uniref:hypothetical protein n=1 Tax=Microbacterium sp. CPCC 204701 TaxID=2493084 RepID=UPI000FD90D47|nr:hypothetical protein [Microbacterium sp. CPCC 204701]
MTSAAQTGPGSAVAPGPSWRFWTTLGVWTAVVAGFVVLLATFGELLAMALGRALGGQPAVAEMVPAYWSFVWTSIGLGAAAVAAASARRWVALVLALLLAAGGGVLAVGLFPQVRSIVAPAEQVDPAPLLCQCHSGGTCDCPGG